MSALFSLGVVVATPGALELLDELSISPDTLLERHAVGDWGSVCKADARENERSVRHGFRIISTYDVGDEGEADRSSTCILLPSEY